MARKSKDKLIDALSDYKSAREAMIHADEQEFMHHLRVFLKELEGNYLCKEIVSSLPEFDVNAWWQTETQGVDGYSMHLESLDFPDDKDERLVALLELARTIGSDNRDEMSLYQFGRLFGLFKNEEALNIAKSIVFRPLADDLTRRLRKAASLANPEIRDLTGVPHARIPANSETAIFLSHKSANKDLIRRYHAVLKELGYDPWLDEEAIVAGQTLHRALASGMDRSCAAVFFITPDFKDESWLKSEIDLAMDRQVQQGSKFQIITLVFDDAEVPRPLRKFVYVKVEHGLQGLQALVKALPIELGSPIWRERVLVDN